MISGVVLAAGTSSRFGRPKQLLDLGGKPVLRHAVDAALASPLDEVVVVLGHMAMEVAVAVPGSPRVKTVINPQFADGQSSSLRTGLGAVSEHSGAAVIFLGDQPGIHPEAVAAVVAAFREGRGPVVQAAYGGRAGHPTLLVRSIWPELTLELEGDQGARSILRRHPSWSTLVEVGGHPPEDIDTLDDYERARFSFGNPQ